METFAADPSAALEHDATVARQSPAMVMRCLLVSVDLDHIKVIESAAANQGWLSQSHVAVDEVLREVFRKQFHLAFVDTQSAAGSSLQVEYEQLAADLARNHVPLIVISGEEGDPLAEIRARQLGVWLYLPGFDGKTELDVVFRDAREVHEKLRSDQLARSRSKDRSTSLPGTIGHTPDAFS